MDGYRSGISHPAAGRSPPADRTERYRAGRQGQFPGSADPIREQTGNGIAYRRFRRQKTVRIFLEQFSNLLQVFLRNHQRVQDPGVGKLRFQEIPLLLSQFRRKVYDS